MNRSKAKGTAAETAVTNYLKANGYDDARRVVLAGAQDNGDIHFTHTGRLTVIEVKNVTGQPAEGRPSNAVLEKWLSEAQAEARNANAHQWLLVLKRIGTTDVGRWWCWMPVSHNHHPRTIIGRVEVADALLLLTPHV